MRKFFLQKETGERIALNNETGIMLSEPEGLGLTFGDTFAEVGEGFYKTVAKKYPQQVISGKLNFITNPYASYNSFIDWCMKAKKLYFIYSPSGKEYYVNVEIDSITKTEINRSSYLETELKLKYLSPWYLPTPLKVSFSGGGDTAFRFDNSRLDDGDVLTPARGEQYSAEIQGQGQLPGAVYVEFLGVAEKPEIILTGMSSNIKYGHCKIDYSFPAGSKIMLATTYEDSYVKGIVSGNEIDLLPYVDLTEEPFFKLPLDEPCILKMVDDQALSGDLSAKAYFYYRSV